MSHKLHTEHWDCVNTLVSCGCGWCRFAGSTAGAERLFAAHVRQIKQGDQLTMRGMTND